MICFWPMKQMKNQQLTTTEQQKKIVDRGHASATVPAMPAMVSGVEVPPGPARPVKDWVLLCRQVASDQSPRTVPA